MDNSADQPPVIDVVGLKKTYRVYNKADGFTASIRGLFSREYKEVHAVSDVSFQIARGEMVAFLGPNGAGKTTTLKLLSGLLFPSAGDATVMGYKPWQRKNAYRRRIAVVMGQKNQLWWDLPARESFELHKEIYQIEPVEYRRRLDELTSLLEVKKLIGQPVRELSLGERMRMELIASLLHSPDVLLLDEPTIGLDVVSQRRVQEFLKHYQDERGITVLLTSHYMKDVQALCKRVIVIDDGVIRTDGPLDEIVDRFSQTKILEFLFSDKAPADLARFGSVLESTLPRVRIEVARGEVPRVLTTILGEYAVEDVSVHEKPLEDVIEELFSESKTGAATDTE